MILNTEVPDDVIEVDIGRPSMFSDEDCDMWSKFHDWVISTSIGIWISGAFWTVKNFADDRKHYAGSGYKYCFWFSTQSDADLFKSELKRIVG